LNYKKSQKLFSGFFMQSKQARRGTQAITASAIYPSKRKELGVERLPYSINFPGLLKMQ
jgi:hypothetical protein